MKVVLADSAARALAGGEAECEIEAATVRGLVAALEARHPGLGDHVQRRMAIAIDGEIHQDALGASLASAREVVLIPRIGGG